MIPILTFVCLIAMDQFLIGEDSISNSSVDTLATMGADLTMELKMNSLRLGNVRQHFQMDEINKQHHPNPSHVKYKYDLRVSRLENAVNDSLRKIIQVHEEFLDEVRVLTEHFAYPGLKELIRETTTIAKALDQIAGTIEGSNIPDMIERLREVLDKSADLLCNNVHRATYLGREVKDGDTAWNIGERPTTVESARARGVRRRIDWCSQEDNKFQHIQIENDRKQSNFEAIQEMMRYRQSDPNTTIWDDRLPDMTGPRWQRYVYHLNRVAQDNYDDITLASVEYQELRERRIVTEEFKIMSALYAYVMDILFRATGVIDVANPIECYHFDIFRQQLRNHVETGSITITDVYELICQMLYLHSCIGHPQNPILVTKSDEQLGVIVQTLAHTKRFRGDYYLEAITNHFPARRPHYLEALLDRITGIKNQTCDCQFHRHQIAMPLRAATFSMPPTYQHLCQHLDKMANIEFSEADKKQQFVDTIIFRVLLRLHHALTPFTPMTCFEEGVRTEQEGTILSPAEKKFLETQFGELQRSWSTKIIGRQIECLEKHKAAVCPCTVH